MKYLTLLLALAGLAPVTASAQLINGAGSSFDNPAFTAWFQVYEKVDPSVHFNYQSIGSGGGIKAFSDQTVDFGASDAPMTDDGKRSTWTWCRLQRR